MKLVINKCTLRNMDCFSTTWNPPNTEETTVKATEWRSVHPSESVYDTLLCPVLISQWHTPKKCQEFVHKSCPVSTFCSIVSDKWRCDGTSKAQVIIPLKRFSDKVRLLWIVNNCNILAVLIPIVLYIESENEGCPVLKRDSTSWHFMTPAVKEQQLYNHPI